VESAGLPIPPNYQAVILAVKDKVRLLSEVPHAVDFLLKEDFCLEEEAVNKVRANSAAAGLLTTLSTAFRAIPEWSADAAKSALNETAQAAGAKPGQLMFPLRVALSGRGHGPDLGDVLNLLGKERCATRVEQFAKSLG
jgi:glutamyl-tRNA synthetase